MKKQTWIAILMISSQLLLTGFVAYWLVSQYRDERIRLNGELKQEYLAVREQMLDSVLLRDLIKPTLGDSMIFHMDVSLDRTMGFIGDTGRHNRVLRRIVTDSLRSPGMYAFKLGENDRHAGEDSGVQVENSWTVRKKDSHDPIVLDTLGAPQAPDEEMMVRTVKLFITHTEEGFRSDPARHIFSMPLDSFEFGERLEEQFAERGWNFTLDTVVREPAGSNISRAVILSFPDRAAPSYRVSGFGGYLFLEMVPQLLFALFLIGMTASALWIAFRSLKKQVYLNKLRDDFISNISHELQTPVSTVKVALEALNTFDLKKDPGITSDYLHMASREVERLESLVGKVLRHSMLENGSGWLRKERIDLRDLVLRVIHAMETKANESHARIRFDPGEKEARIWADPVYIESVISNLVDNSIKYAGPEPGIGITISGGVKDVRLSVSDNGPGIPPEYREQVFDRFFRIRNGDLHDVKGYGLGLSLARQIMKQHGGSITLENNPGGGCVFTLHFERERTYTENRSG